MRSRPGKNWSARPRRWPTPTDVALVFRYLFDWRFFTSLAVLLTAGLLLPDSTLQPFRSVRFNIWLFAVIAAASIFGTFFPKIEVYHSGWFSALLALMAFDVVACKLRRGPLLIHGIPKRDEERSVERLFSHSRLRASLPTRLPIDQAGDVVRSWLGSLGLRFYEEPVRAAEGGRASAFFAARHRVQRWGDMVLHVSIVAILAGGLMGALYGFDEILPLPVGETMKLKHRPLEVTLEDFDIQYYPSGEVSRYASQITVRQNGADLGRKRIVVNDPLDINRVRFYQASWGMTPSFRTAVLRIGGRDITVRPGEPVALAGGLSVRANRIAPTFELTPDGRMKSADFHGHNPALQLDFIENGEVKAAVWLLLNRPEAYRIIGQRVTPAPPPPFLWVAVDPILFSGIQVGYDPGAPLFWLGAICLMAGLCSHFYLHQRRLRVAVVNGENGANVLIGGWNSRTPSEFETEFEDWVERLRRQVA